MSYFEAGEERTAVGSGLMQAGLKKVSVECRGEGDRVACSGGKLPGSVQDASGSL